MPQKKSSRLWTPTCYDTCTSVLTTQYAVIIMKAMKAAAAALANMR